MRRRTGMLEDDVAAHLMNLHVTKFPHQNFNEV